MLLLIVVLAGLLPYDALDLLYIILTPHKGV